MKLIYPCEKYLKSYQEAYEEQQKYCPNEGGFCPPHLILETAINYREGINMRPGLVKRSIMWLIDDEEFIGFSDIRHELDDVLLHRGGHIGYAIRYTKRHQGYGNKILELSLDYIKNNLDYNKVLLTCDDDKIESYKIIEKFGGILQDKIENDINGKKIITRRYWISLI